VDGLKVRNEVVRMMRMMVMNGKTDKDKENKDVE
jgi:hypothetical protein